MTSNAIFDEILLDVKAFADSPSDVRASFPEIEFELLGHKRKLRFVPESGSIRSGRNTIQTPAEYLALQLAKLDLLANQLNNSLTGAASAYVAAPCNSVEDAEDGPQTRSHVDTVRFLRAFASLNNTRRARLGFITGPAGIGKSTVLRALSAESARAYTGRAGSGPLLIYFDAQGQTLAQFKNVVAGQLQELRAARIYYEGLVRLTQRGLVVPIVDAFDELLVEFGAGEAFGSLGSFLADIGDRGCVIASARREFFVQRDFHRQSRHLSESEDATVEVAEIQMEELTAESSVQLVMASIEEMTETQGGSVLQSD